MHYPFGTKALERSRSMASYTLSHTKHADMYVLKYSLVMFS